MKARRWRCSSILSLTSASDAVSGQRHDPATLTPEKRIGSHYKVSWVGPWDSLDIRGNCCPHGIRCQDRRARSDSLYRLSYRDP